MVAEKKDEDKAPMDDGQGKETIADSAASDTPISSPEQPVAASAPDWTSCATPVASQEQTSVAEEVHPQEQGSPVPPPPASSVEGASQAQVSYQAENQNAYYQAQPQAPYSGQQVPPPYGQVPPPGGQQTPPPCGQQTPPQNQAQQPYGQTPPPYGQQVPPQNQSQQPYYCQQPYQAPVNASKDHVAAGLLGIFLGALGIHKFYLGYNTPGFIMLAVAIIGGLITCSVATWVVWLIGVIEGIIYLTKSQSEFEMAYVANKREWF